MSQFSANLRPTFNSTSPIFNVTAQQSNTHLITVTDGDGDVTTLWLETDLPPGATFNNVTGEFVWVPESTDFVNIT